MAWTYPPNPLGVPPGLALPSPRYRRHVWTAAFALLAFVGLYAGTIVWLVRLVWRMASAVGSDKTVLAIGVIAPSLFLLAFLVKGLFFVRRGEIGAATEITAEEEPELFAFITRVADEVGAPRPHRVFLTPDVNASVFYDLSLRSLVFPSKKNLNIGLGLVNVLTLDEFKAVLAHEFGHFAQRSMALGTWVYVSGQVIGAIVGRRDGFDTFIRGLSRFDLRVAWVGWGLGLLVWAMRAVFDSAYRLLLLVDRALSREMEFQADLVAVSITGSDSLIHALRRLGPADQALNRAYDFATDEGRAGRPIADVYRAQSEILGHLRRVDHDPLLGAVPEVPKRGADAHRVFSPDIAEAPRMWSTHPPNHEREAEAKRRYVPSTLDARSAWTVFRNPAALASRVTRSLYEKNMPALAAVASPDAEVTREALTRAWTRPALATELMGVYTDRSPVLWAREAAALADTPASDREEVLARLDALYPRSLVTANQERRAAESHVAQLEALAEGLLTAPGGVIRYRGEALARSALPQVLTEARADRDRLQGVLAAHDRAARAAHLGAARLLGKGWEDHLRGLAHTLHYLTHQRANVIDAHGLLLNVWALAAADGTISEREIPGIIRAANESQAALAAVYQSAASVRLPERVAVRLDKPSWKAQLGEELGLPPATRDHLAGNWLQVEQGWVNAAVGHLQDAVDATLDELLEAEAHVARCFRIGEDALQAAEPAALPAAYPTLHPGSERKRSRRLGAWDRFQTADGFGPGVLRFGAASAVLAPPVYFGLHFGSAIVLVHNGLDAPVHVTLNDVAVDLRPFEERLVDVDPGEVELRATTAEGVEIERRTESATSLFQPYVYNVAGADGFYKTWIRYGSGDPPAPSPLGASAWFQPDLHHVGEEPPTSIKSDSPVNHSVLSGAAGFPPTTVLAAAPPEAHAAIIGAHLRYDSPDSADYAVWAQVAGQAGVDGKQLVVERATGSTDPALGRLWQELDAKAACAAHTPAARAAPENADLAYLATRCLPDGPESDVAFAEAHARFPESGWIRWATATSAGRQADWARMGELAASPFPRPLEGAAMELRLQAARMTGLDVEVQIATVKGSRGADEYQDFLRAEADGHVGNLDGYGAVARADLLRAAGNLEAAEAVADLPDEERALNACSEGASAAARNGLQALTPRPGTVGALCRLAVLSREAPPDDTALAALAPLGEELAVPLGKLLRAPAAEVVTTGDALAELSFPQARSLLRLVGVLRLGEEAPQRWRDEARALCLPWQRPWLHP